MRSVAIALVGALVLGACGDGDESTIDSSSRDEGQHSDGSPDVCDAVAVIAEWDQALQEAVVSNAGDPEAQSEAVDTALLGAREEVEAAYSDLTEAVPEELSDDAETLRDFTAEFYVGVADGESAEEIFASLGAEAEEAAVAATLALNEYSSDQCGMPLSSPPFG
jgi:hypothetical protein